MRDQLHPGRVVAQDVADHQLPAVGACAAATDALGVGHRRRQRLLDEDMRARFHRHDGVVGMAVGIGVDRAELRLQLPQRLGKDGRIACSSSAFGQLDLRAVDQADDLEAGIVVIGERMARAHIAEAGDQDSDRPVISLLLR